MKYDLEYTEVDSSLLKKDWTLLRFLQLHFQLLFHFNALDFYRLYDDARYYSKFCRMEKALKIYFRRDSTKSLSDCIQLAFDHGFLMSEELKTLFHEASGRILTWSPDSIVQTEIQRWVNMKSWHSNEALDIIDNGVPNGREIEIFEYSSGDADVGSHMKRDVEGGLLPIASGSTVENPYFYPVDVITWAKRHKYILDGDLPLIIYYFEQQSLAKNIDLQCSDRRAVGRPNAKHIWIAEYNRRLDAGKRGQDWASETKYLVEYYRNFPGKKPAKQAKIDEKSIKKILTQEIFVAKAKVSLNDKL